MKNTNTILVDYYDGAYGATIRIDIQTLESLHKIKFLFQQLADSVIQTVKLSEVDGVVIMGLCELILKLVSAHKETEKKLKFVSNEAVENIFELALNSKEWKHVVGLMDGLLEYNLPGHQYLTQEGVDDAIVELAFKE